MSETTIGTDNDNDNANSNDDGYTDENENENENDERNRERQPVVTPTEWAQFWTGASISVTLGILAFVLVADVARLLLDVAGWPGVTTAVSGPSLLWLGLGWAGSVCVCLGCWWVGCRFCQCQRQSQS